MAHKWTQTVSHSLCSKARHSHPDGTQMDPKSEPQLVHQSKTPLTHWWHTNGPKQWATACAPKQDTTHILMAHKWTPTVGQSLCSKAKHHSHADGTQMDPNSEWQLVLQSKTQLTSWWYRNGPEQWTTACGPSKTPLTHYKWTQMMNHSLYSKARHHLPLIAHKWIQTVTHSLCSKERHHSHADGTQMDPNNELQLVLQSKMPLTHWWHTNGPKQWTIACTPKQDTTYHLMDPNNELQLVLQSKTLLTSWWHTNGPKQWATACAPKQDTTHILMAHKWTQRVNHSLFSKARHHSHPDDTQMNPNSEPLLVLQSKTPLTFWWHTYRPKLWATAGAPKMDTTYLLMAHICMFMSQ